MLKFSKLKTVQVLKTGSWKSLKTKTQMKKLFTAINVEWLKTKGLGLTYIAMALGALIPLIGFVPGFFKSHIVKEGDLPYSIFEDAIGGDVIKSFTFFIMLLFVI